MSDQAKLPKQKLISGMKGWVLDSVDDFQHEGWRIVPDSISTNTVKLTNTDELFITLVMEKP